MLPLSTLPSSNRLLNALMLPLCYYRHAASFSLAPLDLCFRIYASFIPAGVATAHRLLSAASFDAPHAAAAYIAAAGFLYREESAQVSLSRLGGIVAIRGK